MDPDNALEIGNQQVRNLRPLIRVSERRCDYMGVEAYPRKRGTQLGHILKVRHKRHQ